QHVLKHGTDKWEMISEALKHHTPEQCKEKWTMMDMNTFIPVEKAWYKAERANFWRLWERYGEDWEKIARYIPKRTPQQCEAFFNKMTTNLDRSNPEEFQKGVEALANGLKDYSMFVWKKEESDMLWKVV